MPVCVCVRVCMGVCVCVRGCERVYSYNLLLVFYSSSYSLSGLP